MNYDQFKANDELVKSARDELAKNSTLRLMLEAMDSVSPVNQPIPARVVETPHGLIDHGGYVRGFAKYSELFHNLGTLETVQKPIGNTYGVEEPEEKTE